MKDGQLVLEGKYDDIKNDEYLKQLISIHKVNSSQKEAQSESPVPIEKTEDEENFEFEEKEKSIDEIEMSFDIDGKMMENENDEVIDITLATYKKYFGHYWNGTVFFLLGNLAMIGFMMCWLGGDYLIGNWATKPDQQTNFWYYCGLSFVFTISSNVFITMRVIVMLYFQWKAAKKLHAEMINRIIQAPINLYYDVTPIGKSLNKFSKDLNGLELYLGYGIGSYLA